MDWLLRAQSAPDDRALRAGFDAWLAADPAHTDAWDRARRAWNIVGDVPPVHFTEKAANPRYRKTPRLRARSDVGSRTLRPAVARHWKGMAGGAIAAGLALALLPGVSLRLRADYVTSTAQMREVTLEDGTKVQLGPRSAIDTHYSANSRKVALLAGEAWFDVAHNPSRPFVVSAGGVDARDIGTAFEVRLDPATTTVAVAHGLVGVRAEPAGKPVRARLAAGDRIVVNRETGQTERDQVAVGDVALWRAGRLFANNATVADVVERLRAYQSGWIVITDDALARRRVTGTYDLRDPEAAMQALVEAGGGRVRRITPLLYLLSAS